MISKLRWKLNQWRRHFIGSILRPRLIINPQMNKRIAIHEIRLNENLYHVVAASKASLYTNKSDNITLMIDGGIEPLTSWQCVGWDNLPATKNKLLTGELLINHFPYKVDATVAVLLCGQVGHYNYFHWLYDVLPRLLLIEAAVQPNEKIKYLLPQLSLPFQQDSLKLLGISSSDVISSSDHPFIKARRLITTTHPIHTSWHPPGWTIDFVRSRMLKTRSHCETAPRIYIARGDSNNGRRLLNEAKLIAMLESFGFKSLALSQLKLIDQINIFANAQIVIGVHGAGLTNITFCQPGTEVLEIACHEYPNPIFETISNHLGLSHRYLYCDVPDPDGNPMSYNLQMREETLEELRQFLMQI